MRRKGYGGQKTCNWPARQQTKHGYVSTAFAPEAPDYVIVELRMRVPWPSAAAVCRPRQRTSSRRSQSCPLQIRHRSRPLSFWEKLELRAHRSGRHFLPRELEPLSFCQEKVWTPTSSKAASFKSYSKKGEDAAAIARDLKQQKAVWQAYVAPRPVPNARRKHCISAALSHRRDTSTRHPMGLSR